ncbi:NAD-dependent epimerase/dehydratase family protein [Rhodococcus rhodnii]|uniref:NAD-dependent epimerase/dehydratase family protein n=2 Tax=Rhodococcus rhodnii TaxID=38312 RepID=A0A6P2CAR0_9NOCA|nr:NAD-dependent epimerase/dehydratase family protein [Rhodococcus rhodnii]EOM74545.1 putative NAD-dependent epimerase/dehydratase [Rhodococcus rhodnii LMG 5362]TXG89703.1 NAD-dependent epimerase/dehydratase family protein [Rhodococcus rhodnii]
MTVVVTGSGPVGRTVAETFAAQGEHVRVLTRSGTGPEHPNIELVTADVSDPASLGAAIPAGTTAVVHCTHGSAYRADVWRRELPAHEAVVLDAAERVGAVVVFPESLYSYDASTMPFTEDTPRNATEGKCGVRTELLAARAAAAAPTASVVASDYFGPYALADVHAGERMIAPLLQGKTVRPLGSVDVAHSFTFLPDYAAAMVAVAQRPDLWNAVWHAPTAPAPTQREMIERFADAAGLAVPRVAPLPGWTVRIGGYLSRDMRELAEMLYQFERPFEMSSAASEAALDLRPTDLQEAAETTIAWWRSRTATAAR